MTLLSTIRRAARQVGLEPPTLVLGSGDETWLQMAEWANEVVEDCAERHDWKALHELQTLNGDGATTAFNLASDYARLSKMPALSRSGTTYGFWPQGPLSPPHFIAATTLPVQTTRPSYQIEAGVLTFDLAPATGESYTVSYQSSKPIKSTGTGATLYLAEWAYDSDEPLVPERLVRLGLVWKWKAAKGLDYAEFLQTYERSLENLASADWGLVSIDTAEPDFPSDFEFGEPRVTA